MSTIADNNSFVSYDEYKELYSKYQAAIKKISEDRQINKYIRELYINLVKDYSEAIDKLRNSDLHQKEFINDDAVLKPCSFSYGITLPTITKWQKREMLIKRSTERVLKIKAASKERAVISAAINEYAKHIIVRDDDSYVNIRHINRLRKQLDSIHVEPLANMRRDTYMRLIKFGVFDRQKKEQEERIHKAIKMMLNTCSTENERRKLLKYCFYTPSIKLDKFRRIL